MTKQQAAQALVNLVADHMVVEDNGRDHAVVIKVWDTFHKLARIIEQGEPS